MDDLPELVPAAVDEVLAIAQGWLGRRHVDAAPGGRARRRSDVLRADDVLTVDAVPVLGAAGAAVPQLKLDDAVLDQVRQVPLRGRAADPDQRGDRGRGQVVAGTPDGIADQRQGRRGVALRRNRRQGRSAQQPEEAVDVLLVGLLQLGQPLAQVAVGHQPVPQPGERERLDEVVDRTELDGGADTGDVAGGGHGEHGGPVAGGLVEAAHDGQPVRVGEVQVEQHQVGRRVGGLPQRLRGGVCLPHDLEPVDARDVGGVDRGDPVVVVDDERGDHRAPTSTAAAGSRTVKTAPGPGLTRTFPPACVTIRCTRARPRPRRSSPRGCLVVYPSWKIFAAASGGIPGPSSVTRTVIPSPSSARCSSTKLPAGAASIALSSRLPTMVSSAWDRSAASPRSDSSDSPSRTPRSAATACLASSSAATNGLPIRSRVDRASSPCRALISSMNASACAWSPSSIRPARVCTRLANSCCWARNASVSPRTLSSSRSTPTSSVRSRTVTTAPSSRPCRRIGIRLTTRQYSSVSTVSSGPPTAPASTSRSRPAGVSSASGRPR